MEQLKTTVFKKVGIFFNQSSYNVNGAVKILKKQFDIQSSGIKILSASFYYMKNLMEIYQKNKLIYLCKSIDIYMIDDIIEL